MMMDGVQAGESWCAFLDGVRYCYASFMHLFFFAFDFAFAFAEIPSISLYRTDLVFYRTDLVSFCFLFFLHFLFLIFMKVLFLFIFFFFFFIFVLPKGRKMARFLL